MMGPTRSEVTTGGMPHFMGDSTAIGKDFAP